MADKKPAAPTVTAKHLAAQLAEIHLGTRLPAEIRLLLHVGNAVDAYAGQPFGRG